MFQQLISDLGLKRRLSRCFEHQKGSPSFSTTSIVQVLVVVLLGYRRLRDVQLSKDDPIVLRLLGLTCMPSVPTLSCQLGAVDFRGIRAIERLQQIVVTEALIREQFATIALNSDGSVLGACRRAEVVATEFNKKQASAATTRCTASLHKPRKCWLFTIVAATSTIVMAQGILSSTVW